MCKRHHRHQHDCSDQLQCIGEASSKCLNPVQKKWSIRVCSYIAEPAWNTHLKSVPSMQILDADFFHLASDFAVVLDTDWSNFNWANPRLGCPTLDSTHNLRQELTGSFFFFSFKSASKNSVSSILIHGITTQMNGRGNASNFRSRIGRGFSVKKTSYEHTLTQFS